MAPAALLSCVLFSLVSISVSSDVVRLVGDSVQLDIQDPVLEFDDLFWKFNRTNNVLEYKRKYNDTTVYSPYEDRVEFNNKTYSLTLKNLQKTDSGPYEAKASAAQVKVVAEYRLSVLDPVETPVLTYQINTCTITLTCRGHDLSINSSCYNETCEEQEVTSPGNITLSLSVSGSSIICNHSNLFSWKKDVLEMGDLKRLCADKKKPSQLDGQLPNWVWPVVGVLAVLIILIIIAIIIYWRKSAAITQQSEDIIYAEVQTSGAVTTTMSLEAPSIVYSAVRTKPKPSSNSENKQRSTSVKPNVSGIYESVPDQMQRMEPETIYARVTKLNKPLN